MNILVSACLLGVNCRYDGTNNASPAVAELIGKYNLIPVCPEVYGGLSTPRSPAERRKNMVATRDYNDVTEEFERGAEETLKLARMFNCKYAILKERSPSCGSGEIYDGTFHKKLIPGVGVTAGLLEAYGITVIGESQVRGFRFEE